MAAKGQGKDKNRWNFRESTAEDGAQNGPSHDAVATAIVEGLDILGVVTADRIVVRIASSHPFDRTKPGSIVPVGTISRRGAG